MPLSPAQVHAKLPLFDDRDLATALCAFSSLRRLLAGDFLRDFLEEVVQKLPRFSPKPLGNMLLALGRMKYRPDDAWMAKVGGAVRGGLFLRLGGGGAALLPASLEPSQVPFFVLLEVWELW